MIKSIVWGCLLVLFFVVAGYGKGIGNVPLSHFSLAFGLFSLTVLLLQFKNWQQGRYDILNNVVRELDPNTTYKVVSYGYNYSTFVMSLLYCDDKMVEHSVEFRRQYSPLIGLQYGFIPADLNIKTCGDETFIVPWGKD